ncbi:hypothetical protein [Geoalkalibacter subterraneus]|uniref:hypothetical protein n=1 Tax=Geoalkalibacter subterraneus TaxID=483547 RepID=UPI00307E5E41
MILCGAKKSNPGRRHSALPGVRPPRPGSGSYPRPCPGRGQGRGFNLNMPLPEQLEAGQYQEALDKALRRIERFNSAHLVVCLGLDTARGIRRAPGI